MRLKKPQNRVRSNWQKFLRYNGDALCLTGHCITQLKKRFPDFFQANSMTQILTTIRKAQPLFEEFTIEGLCIHVLVSEMLFVIDILSGEVITVKIPDPDADDFPWPIKYIMLKERKWQQCRRAFKTKYRFVR